MSNQLTRILKGLKGLKTYYAAEHMKEKKQISVDGQTYGERELAQLIRRKMITRSIKDKTKYTRKEKHKKDLI